MRLEKSSVVEPIDPFQGGEFHRLEAARWAASMDDLGLVETVDRFGECVVVTITDTSDGWLDASSASRTRIAPPVGMMHEAAVNGTPIMKPAPEHRGRNPHVPSGCLPTMRAAIRSSPLPHLLRRKPAPTCRRSPRAVFDWGLINAGIAPKTFTAKLGGVAGG